MRKISKGLAIAATVMAIGGASVVAIAQTGPGYGPGGYGGYWWAAVATAPASCRWLGRRLRHDGLLGRRLRRSGGAARCGEIRPGAASGSDRGLGCLCQGGDRWRGPASRVCATVSISTRSGRCRGRITGPIWASSMTSRPRCSSRSRRRETRLLAKLDDSQKSRLLSAGPGYYGRGARGGYGGGPWMMGPGYGMMGGWGGGYR